MPIRLPNASQQAAANAVVDRLDGGGAGTINIYSGAQPADADNAPSGTLLATFDLAATAFGAADATGTATLAGPLSTTGSAAGTAGWARWLSGGGSTVFDCDVTATGGGGTITLDNTSIAVGQAVALENFTYTQPAG